MFRRLITLVFVAALSSIAGTGVGILIAPAEGAETRDRVSAFVDEHGRPLIERLEQGGRALGNAIDFVTSRVSSEDEAS